MGRGGRGKYLGMEIGGTKGQLAGGGVAKRPPLFGRICKYTEEYSFAANTGGYEIAESRLMDRGVLAGGLLAAGEPGGCKAERKTGTEPFSPN